MQIDEAQRVLAQTYLIEAVRGLVFLGCFGLIVFTLYVFAGG